MAAKKNDPSGIWMFSIMDLTTADFPKMKDERIDDLLQIKNPYIAGVAPRFAWSVLNPAPGRYNWAPIDKVIERAKAYNKKVVLRVIGGGDPQLSPKWVWERIKYVDRQSVSGESGYRLPIIWDTPYLSAWNTFIKKLGERYDSNPRIQRVVVTSGHAGELWYMIGDRMTDEQIKRVINYGFEKNFVNAWKKIIRNYIAAFPTKPLVLDLAKTVDKISFLKDNGKERAIAEYAMKKLGHRLYLQQDGLNENTETAGKLESHAIMKKHFANGDIIGFQTFDPARHGDLRKCFEKALAYKARYVEIFAIDSRNLKNKKSIEFLYKELKK